MKTKQCNKCRETKSLSEFYKDNRTPDSLNLQCKNCVNKRIRLWCKNNPEKRKEYIRKYLEKNPEKRKETCRRYITNNPKKRKESANKWARNNLEKLKAITIRRRALIKGAFVERIKLVEVYKYRGWICGICGKKINKNLKYPNVRRVSLDHIIPISKGGTHTFNNVQPAHLNCNISKNNKIDNIQLRLA